MIKSLYFSLVAILALAGSGYLVAEHYQTPPIHATRTNLIHTTRAHRYRVYSHHYFSVEKRDLIQLQTLDNRLARQTNSVYEDQYNGTHPIYHKFHDHNYWSVYHNQLVPPNYKGSHMSHHLYYAIQHRVLRSHGVFSGVNFHPYRHLLPSEI